MKVCPTCKEQYAGGEVFCPVDAARLTTPSQMAVADGASRDPLVGTTLGDRYKIVRRIGEGGMGIVYEALHVVIEKRVALKVLRDDFSSRPEVVERFRQEAKSASRIGHEHIVDISDFGETPSGQSYFVMEYLQGEDLANRLAREGTIASTRALHIVQQCTRALGAAHAKGIVHRDMKPENVFLVQRDDGQDFVKIVDFGIAKMSDVERPGAPGRKLTKTGMIFGTPEYMSPEQAAGKTLDHRVDIYALGVILYEALTGRVPFVGDSFMGVLTQHMFEDPAPMQQVNPSLQLPPGLEEAVIKALAKDPDERYQSMEELGQALRGAGAPNGSTFAGYGEPVRAAARSPRPVIPHAASDDFPARRRPNKRVGMLAIGAVAAIGAGALAGWLTLRPETSTADTPVQVASPGATGPSADAEGREPAGSDPTGDRPSAVAEAADAGAREQAGADEAGAESAEAEERGEGDEAADEVQADEAVAIRVETKPAGAKLAVAGRGVVCDATPCTFHTPAGQPIRLMARRGRAVAARRLRPDEPETLRLTLGRRSSGGKTKRDPGGDLKVPEWYR